MSDLDSLSTQHALHCSSLVHDYFPIAIPLVIDAEAQDWMQRALANGVEAGAVLTGYIQKMLAEMEADSRRGKVLRSSLRDVFLSSGVNSIALTLGDIAKPLSDLDNILSSITWWDRFIPVFGLMRKCLEPEDVIRAVADDKLAVTYCLQDGGCIGSDISTIDELFLAGVRGVQITLNRQNSLGTGSAAPGDGGLTSLGRKAVRRLNQLGVMVDVSHCNPRTTSDVIRCAEAPIMVSHSTCASLFPHVRAKSDELIKAVGGTEGFFGVLFIPCFLGVEPEPAFDVVVSHILRVADLIGVDKVGIGSDWGVWTPDVPEMLRDGMIDSSIRNLGMIGMNLSVGTAPGGMKGYDDMPMVTEALVAAGLTATEIAGILGGNFLRFWRRVIGERAGVNLPSKRVLGLG